MWGSSERGDSVVLSKNIMCERQIGFSILTLKKVVAKNQIFLYWWCRTGTAFLPTSYHSLSGVGRRVFGD